MPLKKVVIVEDTRCRETRMAQKELEPSGFSCYTLADSATYEIAQANPDLRIAPIAHPAIIDEASASRASILAYSRLT